MISEDLQEYLETHTSPEPELLRRIYRHTQLHSLYPRMCSGHYQGRVLKMLAAMTSPKRIIELGAFTGYSTLCFAEGAPGAHIDTIEIDDEAEDYLREVFAASPYGANITLHIGDALEVIQRLEGSWDMAFIDANKRCYKDYFEFLAPRIIPGGYILADNTLWSDKVVADDVQKEAHDPQLHGIKVFNDYVAALDGWESIILPIRDGLTILRKKA